MDQEKIGKFIANCRREKNFTQQELAEKLGVSDRSVSNWENGKNMPDLSLFKPLCEILEITINYTNKKIHKKNKLISEILLFFGVCLIFSAIYIFPSESSWGSIYSVIGMLISLVGFIIINKEKTFKKRLLLNLGYIVLIITMLLFLDYSNVKLNEQAPRFRFKTITTGNVIYYDTLFYDVYRCNFDKDNEYFTIEKNSKPTIQDLLNYCKNEN